MPLAPANKTTVGVKLIIQDAPGANYVTVQTGGGSDVFNKTSGSTTETLKLLNQGILVSMMQALLSGQSSLTIWHLLNWMLDIL